MLKLHRRDELDRGTDSLGRAMSMESLTIRRGRRSDAEFLAWAILAATRSHLQKGWFDIALDQNEEFCLNFLMRLTTATVCSQWHYSGFWVAESESAPISAVSAVSAAKTYPLAAAAILESLKICGLTQSERAAFWRRGAYMFTCTTRPDNDSVVVEVVATVPQRRGTGCTGALLSRVLQHARDQGFTKAEVTCFIGNEGATRAYERAGFELVSERRHEAFELVSGAPGIRRLLKRL
jgi:GNAT superfamily N-acetyltransferase